MATRTEPMRGAPFSLDAGTRSRLLVVFFFLLCALAPDQLVEPPDFALDRLQPVLLQLERVVVDPLTSPGQRGTYALQAFLEAAAPAFEDPQPYVGAGLSEEGEMHSDALVLPGGGARFGEELLQARLPFGGELVHDLRAAGRGRPDRGGLLVVLGDQPLFEQLLEAGVERTVGEGAEHAQQGVEPFTQLVAMHRGLMAQPEHGALEHATLASHEPLPSPTRLDVSLECIDSIHQNDTAAVTRSQATHVGSRENVSVAARGLGRALRGVVVCWHVVAADGRRLRARPAGDPVRPVLRRADRRRRLRRAPVPAPGRQVSRRGDRQGVPGLPERAPHPCDVRLR